MNNLKTLHDCYDDVNGLAKAIIGILEDNPSPMKSLNCLSSMHYYGQIGNVKEDGEHVLIDVLIKKLKQIKRIEKKIDK